MPFTLKGNPQIQIQMVFTFNVDNVVNVSYKKTIFKMHNHRYTLEKYNGMKTRYCCPNCNKVGQFTRYIDTHTNKHLSDAVGCCSRLIKCGYHYKPKQYFQDNNISFDKPRVHNFIRVKPPPPVETSFINVEDMNESKKSTSPNYFIDFLANHWSKEVASELVDTYNIGTSSHWNGATTFKE